MWEDEFRFDLVDGELVAVVKDCDDDHEALSLFETRPVKEHLLLPLSSPEGVQHDLLLFRSPVEV